MSFNALSPEPEDLDALAEAIAEQTGPVGFDELVHLLARLMVERRGNVPLYAPKLTYSVGDRFWFGGRIYEVSAVRRRYNPDQGHFAAMDATAVEGNEATRLVCSAPAAGEAWVWDGAVASLVASAEHALREAILADARTASRVDVRTSFASATPGTQGASPSRSRGLFGDRILAEHVTDAWRRRAHTPHGSGSPAAVPAADDGQYAGLLSLWAAAMEGAEAWDADETWREFVAPALGLLGWTTQQISPLDSGSSGSDSAWSGVYILTPRSVVSGASQPERACLLVAPQPWSTPLGEAGAAMAGGCATAAVVGLLGEGVAPWGAVTNGKQWRLHCASWGDPDVGCTAAETYDLDLAATLASVRPDTPLRPAQRRELDVWRTLFSAGSHHVDGAEKTVDVLKRTSAAYARRVTNELRQALLTSVLPEIAGGFVAYRRGHMGVDAETDATLSDVLRGSLGLVHRLLFVLHAEGRRELPLHSPEYRGQSLTTRLNWSREQVAGGLDLSRSTETTTQYDGVVTLFRTLDHGAPRMGLPSYSGGFLGPLDPVMDFLERHKLSDRVVARTLVALGQVDGEPVDYTALTARNLSAVAEGLLESTLWVVEAQAGQVALVSAAGTPQSASSAPVPEYVGVSVVERAIDRVLKSRADRLAKAMDRVAELRRASTRAAASLQTVSDAGKRPSIEAAGEDTPADARVDALNAGGRAALRAAEDEAIEAMLGVRVVDPAVGGGVFLVAALDAIADGVMRLVAGYHREHCWVPYAWNPLCRKLHQERRAIVARAAAQGVTVDPACLDDGTLLARMVAERSLYGVDLSPAAVASAKAVISVRCFVVGAPFVSVHQRLRVGNSLVGLGLEEAQERYPDAAETLSDLVAALSALHPVRGAGEPAGFAEPSAWDALRAYEAILDLLLSEAYGNRGAYDLVRQHGRLLLQALHGAAILGEQRQSILDRARELRQEHGFLHWEAAFPEVFLGPARSQVEQAGFDVVVGSPPADYELGVRPMAGGAVAFAAALSSRPAGPFGLLARKLARVPGGRTAFVITPH